MKSVNDRSVYPQDNDNMLDTGTETSREDDTRLDVDTEFNVLFGWLAAMSVSIASAALATLS
ncbi:MAG: hypothetical protein WBM09_10620 [Gallionella sp.]